MSSVLQLYGSGALDFRAPNRPRGNGKTYSGTYTMSGGSFNEAICGYRNVIMVVAVDDATTGATLLMNGTDGDDTYTRTMTFGNNGQEYNVLTRTTFDSRIQVVVNDTNVKNRYFGGSTPTVTQVWDKIASRYGEFSGFTYYSLTSNYPWIPSNIKPGDDPNGIMGAITSFSQIHTALYQDPTWDLSCGEELSAPGYVQSVNDLVAWILFGEPTLPNNLKFDVYVDGEDEPNVSVRYSVVSKDDSFSLQTVNAQVSAHMMGSGSAYYDNQEPEIMDPDLGVYVPNKDEWYVAFNNYTWGGGKYNVSYIGQNNALIGHLTAFQKLNIYGGAIAPEFLLMLQFTQQLNVQGHGIMTRGQLFDVVIPRKNITSVSDISVYPVSPSEYESIFNTTVEIHLGPPPDMDVDDDDDYPDPDPVDPDFDDGETGGFPGKAILTQTYAMTGAKLENVGTKLWTQSYFDVLKIQSNPIENIVGCKWYPFSITGTDKEIKVGDVLFGIHADVISTKYVATIGTYTYTGPFNNEKTWMAMSPYATVKLHLPYVGIVQLDPTEIFGRALTVKYTIDLITGDCLVLLYLAGNDNNIPYMSIPGSVGVDIPLTSTNRVQSELRAASGALSAGMSAAGQLMAENYAGAAASAAGGFLNVAGQDYTSQRTANHNSACSTWENQYVYVEVWYHPNAEADSYGFKKLHGLPCHKYCSINSNQLSGYVQADQRTKIDFAMTAEENRMLEQLVKNGIYVD